MAEKPEQTTDEVPVGPPAKPWQVLVVLAFAVIVAWNLAVLGRSLVRSYMANVGYFFGAGVGFSLGTAAAGYAVLPRPRARVKNRIMGVLVTFGLTTFIGMVAGMVLAIPLILVARDERHAGTYGICAAIVLLSLDWLRGSSKRLPPRKPKPEPEGEGEYPGEPEGE